VENDEFHSCKLTHLSATWIFRIWEDGPWFEIHMESPLGTGVNDLELLKEHALGRLQERVFKYLLDGYQGQIREEVLNAL